MIATVVSSEIVQIHEQGHANDGWYVFHPNSLRSDIPFTFSLRRGDFILRHLRDMRESIRNMK